MLILPLIDLLILMGSGCLAVGFVLKSIEVTTHYEPAIIGFSSIDFLLMAGVCLGFSLTLAARTWVKLNEPLLERGRAPRGAPRKARELESVEDEEEFEVPLVDAAAGGRRR